MTPITKGLDLSPPEHLKIIQALITVMKTERPYETEVQEMANLMVANAVGELITAELDYLADKMGYQWDAEHNTLEKKLAVVIDMFGHDSGRHRSRSR